MPSQSDTPPSELPQRLAARRKTLGISQTQAATRTGVTLRTWQRWESGETRGHMGYVPAMAAALETTTEELLGAKAADGGEPRGLDDLALEERLAHIEETQDVIAAALRALAEALGDPESARRAAEQLLASARSEGDRPASNGPS